MFTSLARQITRFYYSYRCARRFEIPYKEIDVSGPCIIHGQGEFQVGQKILVRATRHLPVELYCAAGGLLVLQNGCFLNQGVHIACASKVVVGEQSLLADQVLIMDTDFHPIGSAPIKTAPIIIERGAWVGARAIVLKGVTVGEGAVVGAGAVVTRSIPPHSLAVGNPARIVRQWQ